MEDKRWMWILVTAIAPIAWGSGYVVTHSLLPAESPLWGGVLRALPAGLIVLLLARRLPRGSWWWRRRATTADVREADRNPLA